MNKEDQIENLIEEMAVILKMAILRIEIANAEGDPILSAWRETAESALRRAEEFIRNRLSQS